MSIESHIEKQDQRHSTSAGNPDPSSPRYATKLDLLKAAWRSVRNSRPGDSGSGPRGRSLAAFVRTHLALTVIAGLLLFPIAAIILAYITRPAPGTASQAEAGLSTSPPGNATGDRPAKPPAGRPQLAVPQAPPPVVIHPPSSASLEPQAPPAVTVPARPLNPAPALPPAPNPLPPPASPAAARPPYPPVVYPARRDKFFGNGCSGQLTLDSRGLVFRCADDPGGRVQVALDDIESVDGNGVRLVSGKKYHFSIAGLGRDSEEELFANWLSRVR